MAVGAASRTHSTMRSESWRTPGGQLPSTRNRAPSEGSGGSQTRLVRIVATRLCNRTRGSYANRFWNAGLPGSVDAVMTDEIRAALETDRTIDITTIGRTTGRKRRIEMWFHNVDGCIYITGMPGTRSWYANMLANPGFIFHLKESVQADLPATARPILDEAERRRVFETLLDRLGYRDRIESWLARSPLVEVTFA